MARQRRRARGSRVLISLILTVLLLLLARSIAARVLPLVHPAAENWPVITSGEALITGQAHVLIAPVGGQLEPLAEEGARVAKGAPVLRLAQDPQTASWRDEREQLSNQYQALQEEIARDTEPQLQGAAARYLGQVQRLRDEFAAGRLPDSQSLEVAAAQHDQWLRQREELEAKLESLKQVEDRLRQLDVLLEAGAPVVRAPVAGTVTYRVDGLEEILVPERFIEMGPATFARWLAAAKQVSRPSGTGTGHEPANRNIQAGTPVAAILDSWVGLVALPAPPEAVAGGWVAVDDKQVWILDGQQVQVRVLRISSGPDHDPVVIAELASDLPHFLTRRVVPFEVSWGQVSGHVLPVSAVQRHGDGARVVVAGGGRLRWKPVQVMWERDDHLLVDGLTGDEVILRHAALGSWLLW